MKKILVVDDSDVNLYLIQTLFEDDEDIEIIIVSDSNKTISLLKEMKPHVLILDLMMPHMDGFEVLHQIKADPGLAQIPIVVISAYLDENSIEKIKNHGVNDYLAKPIDLDETETKIRSLLP